MQGAFTILSSREDDQATTVVYLESLDIGRFEEKDALVQEYCQNFASILAQSIPIEEYLK